MTDDRAADLAAAMGMSVEEAKQRIEFSLRGEAEPLSRIYVGKRVPRWKRLIPGWRHRLQRQIITELTEQ